jgi:HAD superfamily hydrolase (TIGR01509 family)
MGKELKGIIFDFNGVLWWDTALQGESWSRYAEILRGSPLTPQEIEQHVWGRDNRYILRYLTGQSYKGRALEMHNDHKETIYRNLCLEQGQAFRLSPGAGKLLDWLRAHNVLRTIATSAGKENMLFYFLHLHLENWFNFDTLVYDDDRMRTKPAPDPYLRAAGNLGLPPGQCAVVEDSIHGIQAAQAAGIGYIIALGPNSELSRLAQIDGVNITVENLGQVPVDELFILST